MKLKSLHLKNWGIFHGSHSIDFDPKLTILFGENGGGKSTMYEALKYVLTDVNYSDEDLAKYVSLQWSHSNERKVGDIVETIVEVTVRLKDSNNVPLEHIYRKTVRCELTDLDPLNLKVTYKNNEALKDELSGERVPTEFGKLLSSTFPVRLRPYSIFDGEKNVNFSEGAEMNVKELIKSFSNSYRFEAMHRLSMLIKTSCEKEYDKRLRLKRKSNKKLDSLIANGNRFKKEKDDLKDRISNLEKQIHNYQELSEKAEDAVRSNSMAHGLMNVKREKEEEIRKKKRQIEEEYVNYLFDKGWLLLHFEDIRDEYVNFVSDYNTKRIKFGREFIALQKSSDIIYPMQIPRSDLKSMLDKKHCSVCDRSLEGSSEAKEAFEYIKKWLDTQSAPKEKDENEPFRYDILRNLRHISDTYDQDPARYSRISEQIEDLVVFNQSRYNDIINLKEDLDGVIEDLKSIGVSGSDDDYRGVQSALQNQRIAVSKLQSLQKDLTADNLRLEEVENNLRDIERQKKQIAKGSGTDESMEREEDLKQMLTDVTQAVDETKQNVFRFFVKNLEENSQIMLGKIYSGFQGSLKFKEISGARSGIVPTLSTEQDIDFRANTSLKTSLHIAVLLAINELASNAKFKDEYPLIFDAPISSFDSHNSDILLSHLNKNCDSQVVMFIKNFVHDKDKYVELDVKARSLSGAKKYWIRSEDRQRMTKKAAANLKVVIENV